jgi:large subunit ribosomal protein LP2
VILPAYYTLSHVTKWKVYSSCSNAVNIVSLCNNNNTKMIEVAALLLCKLGGQSGSTEEIKAVLAAAGLEPNEDNLSKLMGDLEGKDINELLAAGQEKIKDIPFGGGGGGGGGAATGGGGDAGAPAAAAGMYAPGGVYNFAGHETLLSSHIMYFFICSCRGRGGS